MSTLKIIWLIIGAVIICWTGYWRYRLNDGKNYNLGNIALGLLFSSGIYALAIYALITLLWIIIYFIIN